ncbi:hepatocyte growth factor receptor-like [Oppia nitens]|uniref:hepatocyte growth factor receptor-like n=1 Tax=Oppia nitens TaxID=1686743 RepID=UPI0023DCE469|nr:hepatocyte growth factor receptor-like [Oppia nitens]XP_054159083.1 hepatocyte growth factor receptor-like [Oppia nitens]
MLTSNDNKHQINDEIMDSIRIQNIYIERKYIKLESVLGMGEFGKIYKALLFDQQIHNEIQVAAKTIKKSKISDVNTIETFLKEGLIMKDFNHLNVLTLIGVCFETTGEPIIVLPFMSNGDLLSYIRNDNNYLTARMLLMFAIDIAKGMSYLSEHHIIHRDLAARNCLIDDKLLVKIADFGLSRDLFNKDYYKSINQKCKLPVKWMSPESLERGIYDTKTDVWSYGVLVWELMTRGVKPYPNVSNNIMLTSNDNKYQISDEIMDSIRIQNIYIERKNIRLESVLGMGEFGKVYKALLFDQQIHNEIQVAAKTLKKSKINDMNAIKTFLKESLIMKDFNHLNVLKLIGVSFELNGEPIIVLPFMANGDLLSYIRNDNNYLTARMLLMFAIDIAKGMVYLSEHRFIQRDLAARNCVIDDKLLVKIADFGLSRDLFNKDYYKSINQKCKLPVKWMSPENLEKGIYDTKTDVWSYGILVWELLTRGHTPYPNISNNMIDKYLKHGNRLLKPHYCPQIVYKNVLMCCWSNNSQMRPTFAELVVEIESIIEKIGK